MSAFALPPALVRAWDRAAPRERAALAIGALVVIGALAWAFVWQPMTRDLERLRDARPRDAATLASARALAADIAALSRDAAPSRDDLRGAVERALAERGLRAPAVAVEAQEGRVRIVAPAVPFATVVGGLDALRRDAAAFVVEGTITPRVEPGTVRAELAVAR